jgi:hypothetical protein
MQQRLFWLATATREPPGWKTAPVRAWRLTVTVEACQTRSVVCWSTAVRRDFLAEFRLNARRRGLGRAVIARVAILFLGVGVVLMTVVGDSGVHLIGLGVWWFGVLLVIDLFLGDGLAAQFLWGIGVGAAVLAYGYDRARVATEGTGLLVVATLSVLLGALALLRSRRREARPAGLRSESSVRVVSAARPDRRADPCEGVARTLTVMAGYIEQARTDRSGDAAELARLLSRYRARHGADTVATSAQPAALRTAVTKLARDLEAIRQRQPVDAPGYAPTVLVARYADLLADLVLDRRRG